MGSGWRCALCLSGWADRLLRHGDVVAEMQGTDQKIHYLLSFLHSLKRIRIREKVIWELDHSETGFVQQ